MKRKTKITISALAVMFVAAIAVAIASFSLAGGGKDDDLLSDSEIVADASANVSDKTIIDYIIDNSNSTDDEVDKIYHIAEITSGAVSTLETYAKSGAFKNYVVDGNRTIDDLMAEGCVEFKSFKASVDDADSLAYISNADFIYVTNDKSSEFTKTNDMSEDLYDILHSYAIGDFKPLVIDNPKAVSVDESTSKNMRDLASSVFGPSEKYYYAFKWDDGVSSENYLAHNGSLYLGINGATRSTYWSKVYETANIDESSQQMSMAKILTVTEGAAKSTTRTDELLAGNAESPAIYDKDGVQLTNEASKVRYYKLSGGSIFDTYAYNARTKTKPIYIENDIVSLTESSTLSFDDYDLIVIEDSCFGQDISADLYKKFAQAMYGKVHIVYSSKLGTSDATEIEVPDDLKETVYQKLFYMVATTDYSPRYENIMVTTRSEFGMITTSDSAATAKVIADLINASKYRGIGGRGSSGSMFTVLELQPCYPIDEQVAQEVGAVKTRNSSYSKVYGSGNYYTVPAEVVNGKTKEQVEEGTEYYAWELSKAKIADALNLSVDKINLVQMSTEEFAADKSEILGMYDLIYIGGNRSALKDVGQYRSLSGLARYDNTIGSFVTDVNKLAQLPIYTMFAHNGDLVNLDLSAMASSPGPANKGTATAMVRVNGKYEDTFTVLNGNDITYSRYTALKAYIDAGMPVVISKEVTEAFELARNDGYLQNSIDPDCNMYKVLKACDQTTKNNVVWNFDQKDVESVMSDGTLGDTLTGYVEVFKGESTTDAKNLLSSIYATSTKRPKLAITSMPATYNRFDATSKLEDGTLKFKYTVTGASKYTVKLYIDDDGNSSFDRKEEYMATGDANSLTYTCSDKFFGPLYWMIEVTTADGQTVNQTGIAYVKNKTKDKQNVNVLQIMPGQTSGSGRDYGVGEGAQGTNSLYFCTVCQQAYSRLEYNAATDAGSRTAYNSFYGGNYYDTKDGVYYGHYLGKHEHTFGIVSYDSNLQVTEHPGVYGMDDWDNNLADQVNDLYDFDIDIMVRGEFEQAAEDAEDAYVYELDANGDVNRKAKVSDADKKSAVDAFKIDSTDADYEKYNALKTVDEKYNFIKQREYEQLAGTYWQLYQYMKNESAVGSSNSMTDTAGVTISKTTVDARKDLDEAIDEMIASLQTGFHRSGATGFSDRYSKDEIISELKRLKERKQYSDYYSIDYRAACWNDISLAYLPEGESMNTYMETYFKTKDKELEYKEMYKKYSRYAAKSEWIQKCYSTVVLGPSEDFGGDDITSAIALADLKSYIEDDGQLLLFHDTLTKFSDAGTSTLTATLRGYFGMDRYHFGKPETSDSSQNYVKYETSEDAEKYFMMNLSTNNEDDKYSSWLSDMRSVLGATPSKYLTSVAYTDAVNTSGYDNPNSIPYKYADLSWAIAGYWDNEADPLKAASNLKSDKKYGTDRASQNNKGIVTLFPFTLSSELNISGTHSQAYALDLEDNDMTVWYSLAGGNNNKEGSSIYAASPRDGMDNYFIYTYKNVNYCGAGHSKVTGALKDNNDERYLYINIICNSVRNSVKQPTIYVYDYGKDTNNIIKRDASDSYYTKVDSDTSYPDFSFKVTVDQSEDVTLSNVKIFYDLDYSDTNTSDAYVADDSHILIADWSSESNIQAGVIRDVYRYDQDLFPLRAKTDGSTGWETEKYTDANGNEAEAIIRKLKLQPSYFAPYNNEYTYLVIEATDSAGNKVYQRIKIMIKPTLFDLT